MKVLLSVLCIPALVGLVALMRYETLEPCGMFRAEAKRFVLFELTAGGAGEVFEGLGAAPGITMLDNILEATTASMAPVGCLQALMRLHTNDNPSEVLSTGKIGASAARNRLSVSCGFDCPAFECLRGGESADR